MTHVWNGQVIEFKALKCRKYHNPLIDKIIFHMLNNVQWTKGTAAGGAGGGFCKFSKYGIVTKYMTSSRE